MPQLTESTILCAKIRVNSNLRIPFADWQAELNAAIAAFPGFVSLEIISPAQSSSTEWIIEQRFQTAERVAAWKESAEYKKLYDKLKILLSDKAGEFITEVAVDADHLKGGVTEVFVTQVNPAKDEIFREWIAKIHQVEAKFPGFRGVYVQSPTDGQGSWITLLQFDTPENLDRWLVSSERKEVLKDSQPLITSIENHRMISSYSGWFSSLAKTGLPPLWKQTMLVLLVLFPIVMLQMKYLAPQTAGLNRALAMFIANAISVVLISWPMMPIAIWFLSWWLSPKQNTLVNTISGTLVVLLLYLIELIIFWNFI